MYSFILPMCNDPKILLTQHPSYHQRNLGPHLFKLDMLSEVGRNLFLVAGKTRSGRIQHAIPLFADAGVLSLKFSF